MSRKTTYSLAVLLAAVIALAPALAEARAGSSSSSGSRGSRTYQAPPSTPTAPQARPMERSATTPGTTQPGTAAPSRATQPNAAQPAAAAQGGFMQRNPFMAGMLGGLIGVGLGGLLFGSGLFGEGLQGFAGFLGLLLQGALIAGVVYFAIAWFRRRQQGDTAQPQRPAYAYAGATPSETPNAERRALTDVAPLDIATGKSGATGKTTGASPAAAAASTGGPRHDEIGLTDKDYAAFEQLLIAIQAAWSAGDVAKLRAHATPEMLSYFSEQLSANASSGVANHVEDVVFDNGDLAEAWNEGGMEYATVAMRWKARDYMTRLDTGAVIEGDPTNAVEQTEVWTFLRNGPQGRWLLSAIQQV